MRIHFHSLPVIFAGTALIPPATAGNYVIWTLVGFLFQFIIRRRAFSWWTKYNYLLSAALDSGFAISCIFIFFTLQFPRNGHIGEETVLNWWGNTVYTKTFDWQWQNQPSVELPSGQIFGPASW